MNPNPYRGVLAVLLAATLLGAGAAMAGGVWFGDRVLCDAAITLALAGSLLIAVAVARAARHPWQGGVPAVLAEIPAESPPTGAPSGEPDTSGKFAAGPAIGAAGNQAALFLFTNLLAAIRRRLRDLGGTKAIVPAAAASAAIALPLLLKLSATPRGPVATVIAAAACLAGAALAAVAAHYLASIDPAGFPEAPGLAQGARVVGWILAAAAASTGVKWAGQQTVLRILHFAVFAVNAAVCIGLLRLAGPKRGLSRTTRLKMGVLSTLGSRANILASIMDAAERQLGIDLRSTWALTVVRRSLEPLAIGLCLLAWLATSLTVVGIGEQALVERLGVPVGGQPLMPGLHLHWPWPVDRVLRIPAMRVQSLTVGHEAEERDEGPEDVLWARQHAANEYTLLLGDGRDLITIDAEVQFRIADARAWNYRCQNPADALRAIAYRAVMRSTVNRTLSEALSENVALLTGRMRKMIQQDADSMGLGIEVMGFTLGGMHPPVPVASDYQAVVSAELAKVTSVVDAVAYRNRTVPAAETHALASGNAARAEGANALALAAGQAWSFRALESQYHAAPQEFFFRRRLETLEKALGTVVGRFTVVDARFQRDGGELWVVP